MPDSRQTPAIELAGAIWFHSGATNWGNPRRMALLAAIDEHGSISAAARAINLSYKAAWDAVHMINNLADEPLIIRTTGGARGGGAHLSTKAREILHLYQQMEQLHNHFLMQLAQLQPGAKQNLGLLQKMLVHTSARNSFVGRITQVQQDALVTVLALEVGLAQPIRAAITRESWQTLGLQEQGQALAFIKASAIETHLQAPPAQADLNILCGQLQSHSESPDYLQLTLQLDNHEELTVIAPRTGALSTAMPQGQRLWVSFPATNVLIGRSELAGSFS